MNKFSTSFCFILVKKKVIMGTRSWSEESEKYSVGQTVFVRADFF